MYYYLTAGTDANGLRMRVIYEEDHRARSFVEGQRFSTAPGVKPWEAPPAEPITLIIDPDPELEGVPLPTFLEDPVPVMSRMLYDVIRSTGVDNIDVYRAELRHIDGKLASDDYFVFNLVGVVRAVDLQNSMFDAAQPDREICMSFQSVAIDPNATQSFLMFRLAENISSIFIHENVKRAIEAAGIGLVRMHSIADVALL